MFPQRFALNNEQGPIPGDLTDDISLFLIDIHVSLGGRNRTTACKATLHLRILCLPSATGGYGMVNCLPNIPSCLLPY